VKNQWDERLKFLLAIRNNWCNIDYIEFLVQKVWRIDCSVDVADFGCGFGYIGLLLMPLLPKGSTYTGFDVSEVLLEEAENVFADSPFKTKLIKADLTKYTLNQEFDIAISQAVLRHIPNPKYILEKMVHSVRANGLVVCMETDRVLQDAGRYFSSIDYVELHQTELYKKLWKHEIESGGRDYRTGMKIPQYMQELGLCDVQIRINDSVKFANPHAENYDNIYNCLVEANGWNKKYSDEDKQNVISVMMNKGLDNDEAKQYLENEILIQRNISAGFKKEYIIEMPCTPITFGRKRA